MLYHFLEFFYFTKTTAKQLSCVDPVLVLLALVFIYFLKHSQANDDDDVDYTAALAFASTTRERE